MKKIIVLSFLFLVGCKPQELKPPPQRNYNFNLQTFTSNGQMEYMVVNFMEEDKQYIIDSSSNAINFCNELNNLEKNIRSNIENFKTLKPANKN